MPETVCGPCTLEAVYRTIRLATRDPVLQKKIMNKAIPILARGMANDFAPSRIATDIYRIIYEMSNNSDPYKDAKKRSNRVALKLVDSMADRLRKLPDKERLYHSILASIAGNIIDFTFGNYEVDLNALPQMYRQVQKQGLNRKDFEAFRKLISKSKRIVFIGDNAGEIALDTFLLEYISSKGAKITFVVKDSPMSNDATLEDARQVGIHHYVEKIITTGSNAFGIDFDEASPELLLELKRADVIISKGQSNFESLCDKKLGKPIVIMMKTKCEPVGRMLKIPVGKSVLKILR
jgi:uncharacterized protein with ATP-grasp and redox domains